MSPGGQSKGDRVTGSTHRHSTRGPRGFTVDGHTHPTCGEARHGPGSVARSYDQTAGGGK